MAKDPTATRHRILSAGSALLVRFGADLTLDQVAAEAGVSKGGLKYHFESKDDLLEALAIHITETFRDRVISCTSDADQDPGRLARAYVKAHLIRESSAPAVRAKIALQGVLATFPRVLEVWEADGHRWDRDFSEDGIPTDLRDIIITSADGMSMTALWGQAYSRERRRRLARHLTALTYSTDLPQMKATPPHE